MWGGKDSFLIDLRSREDYRTGHIKGAVNVPYEEFEEMQEYDFPKRKILVLYCERGRSKPSGSQDPGTKRIRDKNSDRRNE